MQRVFICIIVAIAFFNSSGNQMYVYSEQQPQMDVHFINVGQGDSILIKTPANKNILIDGGPPKSGKRIVTYLKRHHIKKIDLMIATHPDIDHIGGLATVMKSVDVEKIIDSGKLHSTRTYEKYIKQIYKQKIPVEIAKVDYDIKLDSLINIHILNTYSKGKDNNQSSIVLKISFQEIDFLFMGDLGTKQEKELMKKQNIQAEIMKVAHHGSKTSSSLSFLQQVNPQTAVITYSRENDFGHPVNRVIENLRKVNADIYSTAVYGNLVIRTNGRDYLIMTEKSPMSNLEKSAS